MKKFLQNTAICRNFGMPKMPLPVFSKKAELPIYLVFTITITIVGIMLLFLLLGSRTDYGKKMYCSTIYKARVRIWAETHDDFCENPETIEFTVFNSKEQLVNVTTRMVLDCWNKAAKGRKQYNFICEVLGANSSELVSEADVTERIIDRHYCHLIENNVDDQTGETLACGDDNNIRFLNDVGRGNILVEYLADEKIIQVS